jgi:hypothetical protein
VDCNVYLNKNYSAESQPWLIKNAIAPTTTVKKAKNP